MPGISSKTKPVAARVPNHIADILRHYADRYELTMSDVLNACLRQVLTDETQRNRNSDPQNQQA